MATEKGPYFVGVDVGTGSVRAGLFASTGALVNITERAISTHNPKSDFYEQSSEEIWDACCRVVKEVTGNVDAGTVRGIGFDATCSLVVLDKNGGPISVSSSGDNKRNILLWMDHRAVTQAKKIDNTNHEMLKFVGGIISPEMEMPKLLWLKQNLREQCWNEAGHFFDLPDFITYKATGSTCRSLCSLVCKWSYRVDAENPSNSGWCEDFLKKIGLEDLLDMNCEKIGNKTASPGQQCGAGLSEEAAKQFGLLPNTPVGTSIIDAHAGGVGCLGCQSKTSDFNFEVISRLALICGTSTCHMAVSKTPTFVPGVWGPYYSAMVPELWTNEAGQTAAGKLIDHVVETHPSYKTLLERAKHSSCHPHAYLNDLLEKISKDRNLNSPHELTADLHVWPDYHGNRSPLADPTLRGMVSGLSLSSDIEDLAIKYLATVQALSYGTRHILESMKNKGYDIKLICPCGGLAKNRLYVQTHADVTGLPLLMPDVSESVLLGSAMLGACASGHFTSLQDAMTQMGGQGDTLHPNMDLHKRYHSRKYKVFQQMVLDQRRYKEIMDTSE